MSPHSKVWIRRWLRSGGGSGAGRRRRFSKKSEGSPELQIKRGGWLEFIFYFLFSGFWRFLVIFEGDFNWKWRAARILQRISQRIWFSDFMVYFVFYFLFYSILFYSYIYFIFILNSLFYFYFARGARFFWKSTFFGDSGFFRNLGSWPWWVRNKPPPLIFEDFEILRRPDRR